MPNKENLLPTILVILGATGDLMQKKLAPALFHLSKEGKLPVLFQVVGFSKDNLSQEEFRQKVADMVRAKVKTADEDKLAKFLQVFRYQQGLFEDEQGYEAVAEMLGKQDGEWRVCANKLFYIAASPQFYETIFRKLAKSGLTEPCSPEEGWTRVIVEKPFGKDLQTAQELDKLLGKLFKEEQIYRIDHYLGKETVQNILAFRLSSSFLQDSWNASAIERIHITLLEEEGVGDRGGFYEGIGALRDVGQNHVMQLLALFCMENPGVFDADPVRQKRTATLQSLKIWKSGEDIAKMARRGQYKGYLQEKGVDAKSQTETYFRVETYLNEKRWKGVPIVLEGGKAMSEDRVEVTVTFRHPTPCLCPAGKHFQNVLRYEIHPKERIRISFLVKKPGAQMLLEEKDFSFDYKEAFGEEIADAYERLLHSVFRGDQTLFVSTQEIMAEWGFVDPILRAWQENKAPLTVYEKNTIPL